ncbi:unnamed protein product [Rhizoctonia solani]|uniref:Protein kinase domain-containing protein n=1 Tax=Rhizoctonia solani TaxID=456999 RepID=A0A8H2WNV8_9AGAM|nr:unnamed protein product [Rhizoctonia solani]
MSKPISEDEIRLIVVVEGDDPHKKMFKIAVHLQDDFFDVGIAIQELYWKIRQISIYDLSLYRGNVPFEQVEHVELSDEILLLPSRLVASEWPSESDVDRRLVHIIVRAESRQITNTHKVIAPPSAKTEFDKFIDDFNNAQLDFVQTVKSKNSSSSAMPKHFRVQQSGPAYINIGRPAERTGLPIVLYHPVFGGFLTRLRSNDPIEPEVYLRTREHFLVSQDLYEHENNNPRARDEATRTSLGGLLGNALQKITVHGVQADGVITGRDATPLMIMEMKNEIGAGSSDPSIQAAQSYTRYWSSAGARHWLNWCCCPSILIAIAGPWMCVLGAVFLKRPVIQPLTHFLWIGNDPTQPSELGYISRVFDCLFQARVELEDYYRTSSPPTLGQNPVRPFPYLVHYLDSMGQRVDFTYRKVLCPNNSKKQIFLAETIDTEKPRYIVVKFVQKYNADAHKLLAENKLAPELLYNGTAHPEEQPGPEHAMIVMDFVHGVDLQEWSISSPLSRSAFNDIDTAVKLLHSHNFVFGDLREPNVMILQDSIGRATGRAMLIDFDWCGEHLEGRYPLKMNTTLGWHPGVGLGAVMDKQHDLHMLKTLASI